MIAEYTDFEGKIIKYDDTLYEVKKYCGLESDFLGEDIYYLHYIGPQNTIPVIPEGMTDCWRLYEGCTELINPPIIPEGVKNGSHMFEGCISLIITPIIPNGFDDGSYMFKGCISLVKVLNMGGMKKCDYMYEGCISLKEVDEIPDSCHSARFMFNGCISLIIPPKISNKLKDYVGIFANCSSLKYIPKCLNEEKAKREYLWGDNLKLPININYLFVIVVMIFSGFGLLYFLTRLLM